MKTMHKFAGLFLLAAVLGLCNCGPKLPELPVENVKPYFADAAKTKSIDTAFYEVKDAKGVKLGTVLYSSPYSDNQETPNFAQRVVDGGLYEAWNGLTVDEALGKDVDAVSGATYTSKGVKNSLVARLKAYQKQVK